MIKEFFFPVVDNDVRSLMDRTSTKNIENISGVVAIFETLTLAYFILTRKSIGSDELISVASVLFCILSCLCGFLVTRSMLKKEKLNHYSVVFLNAAYWMLMSCWAMLSSYRHYQRDGQMLTFYTVEILMVIFIILKPWLSTVLIFVIYFFLYLMLNSIDGAAGINLTNYSILVLVSSIGMGMRYHSLRKASEARVELAKAKDSELQDKINILQAFLDIYDKVNLIDYNEKTEMSMRDKEHTKHYIDLGNQTHTVMTQGLRSGVMPDQLKRFIEFTNITTVRERLRGKKLLSEDFINVTDGWFRAQYIPVEVDDNGVPLRVVFTTRNVDEEKQKEERLLRIAMTDELTRLFNRRSYEEDLSGYVGKELEKDFVILSADVNGLKKVNDTIGHVAGDELIKGAADCLLLAVGNKGKVYRIGGDEFAAILHTEDPETVCRDIEAQIENWHGKYSDKLSVSIGYVSYAENSGLDVHDLEKKADDEMYQAKARYYQKNGRDRRVHKKS